MQALSAFQPRSQRVHGYPDKVWSFWQSDEVATLRLLPYHQRGFMVSIVYNNLTIPLHEVDMTVSYKITYEHRDGDQIRMEEVLFHSEHG